MITQAQKYVIVGAKMALDLFYTRAQQEGCLEFIGMESSLKVLPEELQLLVDALKILKKIDVESAPAEPWTFEEILAKAQNVLALQEKIARLEEEKKFLEFEILRMAPLGEFSFEDIKYIEKEGRHHIQFFSAKTGKSHPDLMLICSKEEHDYFMAINATSKTYPGFVEMRIEHSPQDLQVDLHRVIENLHTCQENLRELSAQKAVFQDLFLAKLDAYNLVSAKQGALSPEEGLFSAEIWISQTQVDRLFQILEEYPIYAAQVAIEPGDKVPTIMENKGINRIGQDLVAIYDVPSQNDKDPSGWIFWSFALFFAMITSDAGYGLVYLAFAAYLKWKFRSFKGMAKRFYRLFVVVSCFVVAWGVMTVSFFGIEIGHNNILRKIAPLQWVAEAKAHYHVTAKDEVYQEWLQKYPHIEQVDSGKEFIASTVDGAAGGGLSPVVAEFSDGILLEFSLLVGMIHICLSLLRYARRNWANIGWVLFLLGGYLYFPSLLKATSLVNFCGILDKQTAYTLGLQLVYVGIGSAMILALIQKKWEGLKELMNLVQVFSDVLSYVRLYALALASVIMASTFNKMGTEIGFLGGFVVILIGHITTMGLGIMSGVIHGLRLNFIEWYHFSFEGGGKAFNPLRILRSQNHKNVN